MVATWTTIIKSGFGWLMGQAGINMGSTTDAAGRIVNMGTVGTANIITNTIKS